MVLLQTDMGVRVVLVCLAASLAASVASPAVGWGQEEIDRLREWQERQDEILLARQQQGEDRQRLHDDLLSERQNQQSDQQLHRERQQDEQRSDIDSRLNDHQLLRDDLLQERQFDQSDRQLHVQDLQDQSLDERQKLHDELAHDREIETEDLRRQREQLRSQLRVDRERNDREREQEQQRREREREREQQRLERERDLRDQRRRWRRQAAPQPTDNTTKSYEGAQLWRVEVGSGEANLQRVEDDGGASSAPQGGVGSDKPKTCKACYWTTSHLLGYLKAEFSPSSRHL